MAQPTAFRKKPLARYGKPVAGTGCCCCESCVATVPQTVTVKISGVTAGPLCDEAACKNFWNTTHTLTLQSEDQPCLWSSGTLNGPCGYTVRIDMEVWRSAGAPWHVSTEVGVWENNHHVVDFRRTDSGVSCIDCTNIGATGTYIGADHPQLCDFTNAACTVQ